MESPACSGYTVGKAAGVNLRQRPSEVRLPQGLRFTDVRRSAIGDFPLARSGPCAAKSHGRLGLCPSSCLLCPLRLPSAASLFRANLRCLLDGVSRPERPLVRALRRYACARRPAQSVSGAVPGLPPGAAALCAGRGLRALPGPHEGGHPRAQVRPAASGGPRAGPDAGRGHRPTGGRGAGRDAGGSGSAAPVKIRPARLQPGAVAGRRMRSSVLRKTHPEWRLTLASSTLMRLRATESQAGLTPAPAALECARRVHGLRSGRRRR